MCATNNNCFNLTSVILPKSLESIGNEAFYSCYSLKNITCLANTPIMCGNEAFGMGDLFSPWNFNTYRNATLHVPAGKKDAYSSATEWEKFITIVDDATTDDSGEETQKKCETPTISFDAESNKIIVSSTTDGAVINTTVSNSDCKTYTTNEIPLSGTFTITAYAKKEGYENSETATKQITLSAVEKIVEVEKEVEVFIYDDTHANIDLPTGERVTIEIREGIVTIKSLPINSTVNVYTEGGELWETRRVNSASLTLDLPRHNVYIIKTSGKTFKVKI